jgi:hypothetical protein
MKFLYTFALSILCCQLTNAQNVGIATSTPQASFTIAAGKTVLFGTDTTNYGDKLMWLPNKGAFRAGLYGSVSNDTIGLYSVAMGYSNIAHGDYAVAMGGGSKAIGMGATAIGVNCSASANSATALGYFSTASANFSTALGVGTASGQYATAIGRAVAKGMGSTAMGIETVSKSDGETVVGMYNDTLGNNRLFEVGNGVYGTTSNAMTVIRNGSVGIGTTNPELYSGGIGMHIVNDNYTQLHLQSKSTSAGMEFEPLTGHKWEVQSDNNSNFFIYDRTVNAYRLTIGATGNVGIGTNTATRPLSFPPALEKKISFFPGATGDVGISVGANDFRIYSDNTNARISFGYDDYINGFTSRAYIPATGATALYVSGQINVNGTTYASDLRYKKNIQTLSNSLEKIMELRGVKYEMRKEEFPKMQFNDGEQIGLIAQEVERVIPEIVSTGTDGYKSIDYAKLVPVLVEGLKAQQQEIKEQKEQNETLAKKFEEQQKQIDALKKLVTKKK